MRIPKEEKFIYVEPITGWIAGTKCSNCGADLKKIGGAYYNEFTFERACGIACVVMLNGIAVP